MKKSESILKWLALVPAALLILSLSYSLLNSSDFPRGMVSQPLDDRINDNTVWSGFDSLNQNLVWNFRYAWDSHQSNPVTLSMYLNRLHQYGMRAVLGKADYDPDFQTADSIPYLVFDRSEGQAMLYEAEMDSDQAQDDLDRYGTGYYYFYQGVGNDTTIQGNTYRHVSSPASADTIIAGPYETYLLALGHAGPGWELYREPQFDEPPTYNYVKHGKTYRYRVTAMANLSGHADTTVVFKFYLDRRFDHITSWWERTDSIVARKQDFSGSMQPNSFYFDVRMDTSININEQYFACESFKIYWPGQVELWVDNVEFMDMEQAYPLFWNGAMRDSVLNEVYQQCDSLETADVNGVIAGWVQSDEPKRFTFRSHGLVNDYLIARGIQIPQTVMNPFWSHNYKHFVGVAKPRLVNIDAYFLRNTNSVGNQTELSWFADTLEAAYQACYGDSIPLHATCQAHSLEDHLRNPIKSEIYAQAYIALAHGAKGIYFYCYRSSDNEWGLVDFNYQHPAGGSGNFDEKWQAVRAIYAQLDSIGDILLPLDRYAAYCCTEPNYQSPVTGISFAEGGTNYIEVGQFHDSQDAHYLIIVNRRTDEDRHITINTNYTSRKAMRDLYTQERFLSTTGDFEGIPFEAGQGRVFEFEK